MDERRGSNDEGEPEDVRELRTMADTVREALLDASLIAHGDELLRYVGMAEIASCLTRLEPSAQRTVWNMQPRVQYDPHDPGPALTEASQRRGVETILITRPATLLANPLLPSLYPSTRTGPVFLRALVVDEARVLVEGLDTAVGSPTGWTSWCRCWRSGSAPAPCPARCWGRGSHPACRSGRSRWPACSPPVRRTRPSPGS